MQDTAAPSRAEPAAGSQHPPTAFSLQEAATLLGIPLNTLRRRIEAGQVRAERVERPQGHVWRLYLDGVQPPAQHAAGAGQHPPAAEQQGAASTLQQHADGLMRAEAMAAYTRSVLEPLVAALERSHARVAKLEREVGVHAERMAGLERVRDAAIAHAHELEEKLAAAARPPEPPPDPFPQPMPLTPNVGRRRREPRWRRWVRQVVAR